MATIYGNSNNAIRCAQGPTRRLGMTGHKIFVSLCNLLQRRTCFKQVERIPSCDNSNIREELMLIDIDEEDLYDYEFDRMTENLRVSKYSASPFGKFNRIQYSTSYRLGNSHQVAYYCGISDLSFDKMADHQPTRHRAYQHNSKELFSHYMRHYTTQLGVEYSSNTAGDGPISTPYIDDESKKDVTKINDYEVKKFDYESMRVKEYFVYTHVHKSEQDLKMEIQSRITNFLNRSMNTDDITVERISELLDSSDPIIVYVESGFLFFHDLGSRELTPKNVSFSVLRLVRMVSQKSIFSQLVKNVDYERLFNDLFTHEEEIQSFVDYISEARDKLNSFEMFTNSKIYKKIYKLCMYVLSFSVFEKFGITFNTFGYTQFEAELIRKKFHKRSDFLLVLMDSLLHLLDAGFHAIKTGRIDSIIHSRKEYSIWFDEAEKLQFQSKLLHNPEAHGFNEHEFRCKLDNAIEKGLAIFQHMPSSESSEKRFLRNVLNDLQMTRCEISTKQSARENRRPPYSILVCGDSGIGKSTIKEILFTHFSKIKNLPVDSTYCYTRNPADEYWSGFTTSCTTVILDDVAFMHPNKAMNGDPSVMEFLQVVNAVPFIPNQADLADKGRTPLKAKLCIATTNTEDLNAHYYFSCASAAQRRFPYIIVPIVKDEFKDDRGMLDSTKTLTKVGEYPDWWIWTIKKVIPKPVNSTNKYTGANIEILFSTPDVNEFIKWYSKSIIQFDINQDQVENSVKDIHALEICKTCFVPKSNCECEIQSAISNFAFYLNIFALAWYINFLAVMFWQDLLIMVYNYTGFNSILRALDVVDAFLTARHLKRYVRRMRNRVCEVGRKIRAEVTPTGLMYSAIAIGGILTAYRMYHFVKNTEIQSKSENIGVKPDAKDEENENIWYKNDFKLSNFDLTNNSTSSKALTDNEFYKLVAANTIHMRVWVDESSGADGIAFCLKGHLYITNNHNLVPGHSIHKIEISVQDGKDGVGKNIILQLDESQITRYPESDIAIFSIRNIPLKKGLYKYLPKNQISVKHNGFLVMRSKDGSTCRNNVHAIRDAGRSLNLPGFDNDLARGIAARPTMVGDCGSPLVISTDLGYVIIGLHVAGDGKSMVASTMINQSMFDISELEPGKPKLSAQTQIRTLGDLHPKSVFRYIDSGVAEVYGSFTGFRNKPKSLVEVTPMAHHLSKHGYKIKYGPPVMSGWEPWRIAALDMVKPVVNFKNAILEECKKAFLNDIVSKLTAEDFAMLQVYDNFTAINGAQGVTYVDKINRNTSAGNPWKKSKKFFMKAIPAAHGLDHPVEVDAEIMDRVDEFIESYHKGERVFPNFCAHLKDEPVSFKKIKMGKTRVFAGAPFDWTIVVRKYLLSSIRVIQNNKYIFETAIGTTAQSYQWHEMYDYITQHGADRIVAGDYKSFDKKMSPCFILAAFDILIALCQLSGNYTEEDICVLRGVAEDTAFPLIDFNGDLVQFYGSNPSGHPLTVIINSLVNSLYMRYVYYILNPDKEVQSFQSNVALMTYGDDNIMSVSKEASWYNHTAIAEEFLKMEIGYTMADKEAKSIPYININQASFLKRSWRYDSDVRAYVCPLEHDSIEKSLMVWVRSKSISQEEHVMEAVKNAVNEYFWYGKDIFEEKTRMLKQLIMDMDLCDWILPETFPNFDFLVKRYWDCSKMEQPSGACDTMSD